MGRAIPYINSSVFKVAAAAMASFSRRAVTALQQIQHQAVNETADARLRSGYPEAGGADKSSPSLYRGVVPRFNWYGSQTTGITGGCG